MEHSSISVTDHALVRYAQRILGLDLPLMGDSELVDYLRERFGIDPGALRDTLRSLCDPKVMVCLGSGRFLTQDLSGRRLRLVFRGMTVVTVIGERSYEANHHVR